MSEGAERTTAPKPKAVRIVQEVLAAGLTVDLGHGPGSARVTRPLRRALMQTSATWSSKACPPRHRHGSGSQGGPRQSPRSSLPRARKIKRSLRFIVSIAF